MGIGRDQQSNSSGAVVAMVVAALLIGIVGIVVVAGAGLFFVRTSRVEAMVARERAVANLHRAEAEAHRAEAESHRATDEAQKVIAENQSVATPDLRSKLEVTIDREGNMIVDGKIIDLDELRAALVKRKEETNNAFSVWVKTDPESAIDSLVAVLDTCTDLGKIEVCVTVLKESTLPLDDPP